MTWISRNLERASAGAHSYRPILFNS